MKKPTIFLSHSKKDRAMIERLANELRKARINVWYDEWEIPIGESFTRKIFEDGIPNCDLFFVYLTSNSVESYWVDRELDAAMIRDVDLKGGSLALFVDSDETRNKLRVDLRTLHFPILDEDTYNACLRDLISRVWESSSKNLIKEQEKQYKLEILKLLNNVVSLENEILRMDEDDRIAEMDDIIDSLSRIGYDINGEQQLLLDIFLKLSNLLASGIPYMHFDQQFAQGLEIDNIYEGPARGYDIIEELVLHGLIRIEPTHGEFEEVFYLSEDGNELVKYLR